VFVHHAPALPIFCTGKTQELWCSLSSTRGTHLTGCALLQAEVLWWACGQLRLAEGLRELVLELHDRSARAVSARLLDLGSLTQLSSLVLRGLAVAVDSGELIEALSSLNGLTRLDLQFDYDEYDEACDQTAFPWEEAVCELLDLRELRVSSATGIRSDFGPFQMFKGTLPAAMSQLTALRRIEVLGMRDFDVRDDSDEMLLAELPALETAALRLYTLGGQYPSLCHQQQAVSSRLVSLCLALRFDYEGEEPCPETRMPPIIAPALTELTLDDIRLAPDSEQLSWLPGLPSLRRLVIKDLKTASAQLPHGVMACTGLTELVLHRILVSYSTPTIRYIWSRPDCRLRSLPEAGPWTDRLVRLSLCKNAFYAVPPCLVSATALKELDMGKQQLRVHYGHSHSAPVQGLHLLDNLTRLRCLKLAGFKKGGAGLRRFRAVHPDVCVML